MEDITVIVKNILDGENLSSIYEDTNGLKKIESVMIHVKEWFKRDKGKWKEDNLPHFHR